MVVRGKVFSRLATGGRIAFLAAAIAVTGAAMGPASAQNADTDTGDGSFFKGLGEKLFGTERESTQDYRRRAPLVVPPNRELRAPEDPERLAANPAWPKDPDEIRKRREEEELRTPIDVLRGRPDRVMSREELRRTRANLPQTPGFRDPDFRGDRPISPTQMRALSPKKELVFNGEPKRRTLTQPPAGYQTPSPSQPYTTGDTETVGSKLGDGLKKLWPF